MTYKHTASNHTVFIRILSLFICLSMTSALSAQDQADETGAEPVVQTFVSAPEVSFLNDYVSEVTTVVCPFKDSVEYKEGRVKCGLITVPENREKEDSRMIRLMFAHIVASGRLPDEDEEEIDEDEEQVEVRDDPVAYLTGGPGVSIAPYVSRFLKHDLTKSRDMYILNQRGIGASDEVCRFFSLTSRENLTAVTQAEFEAEQAERAKACFTAAKARGVDVTGYNTVENARDVRALRIALGFEQWNVWGISYGSHLGQMLTQVDKEGIRALVLDAIVPNDIGDLMRIHRWIVRNYDLVFEECERQEASICEGLRERHAAAFNSMVDDPIIVSALDEEFYPSGKFTVPAIIVGLAPFSMQYEQDEHPAIPAVMTALSHYAETRDEEIFQAFTFGDEVTTDISIGMSGAIRCNDGYVAAQAEIAEQDLQELVGFKQGIFSIAGSQMMAQMCIDAGLAPRDRVDYQLVNTDLPTLIVNGDWDPVTPPALAERIAPGFSNGRLIIVPYAGHGPTRSMSECGGQVMTDFFDEPSQDLSALDASCLEEGVEAPEFLDYLQTDVALRMASMLGDDPKRLIGPGAIIGITTVVILFGFIAMLCGYIARRFSSQSNVYQGVGPYEPRLFGFITALTSLAGLGLIGAGAAQTIEISNISIIAGFAPPAGTGAFLMLVAALLGLYTIYTTVKAHKNMPLRRRTIIGLPLVSICVVVLAVYLMIWGITVW